MKTTLLVAAAALSLFASQAHAATRVISPDGSGTACTAAVPCSWSTAYAASSNGDTIQVRGGTYTNQQWTISKSITVEAYGSEKPVLDGRDSFPANVSTDIDTYLKAPQYQALIKITSPNVALRGVTVTRSTGRGIMVAEGGITSKSPTWRRWSLGNQVLR